MSLKVGCGVGTSVDVDTGHACSANKSSCGAKQIDGRLAVGDHKALNLNINKRRGGRREQGEKNKKYAQNIIK